MKESFWRPGWVPTPDPEWDRVTDELIARDRWVMDGNYGRTLPKRIAAADTVVFLDLPRIVCMWRVLKRRFDHMARSRPDVAPGCPEHLTWEFMLWVWTYPSRRRPGIIKQLDALRQQKKVIVLRNANDVGEFLARV